MRDALIRNHSQNLMFNVENGIKTAAEPCSDKLYTQRLNLLQGAKKPLILSLAAGDWTQCKLANGRSGAVERLNRVRELFFAEDASFGASKLPLVRQSTSAKFRSYDENARWEVGSVLFATINIPANNNNYRADAGRNSEFDDRLIANRDWLQRIFSTAKHRRMDGIVLFSDADIMKKTNQQDGPASKRDGYAEVRQQIMSLSAKFEGQILLVHNVEAPHPKPAPENSPESAPAITWVGNVGSLNVNAEWLEISVQPSSSNLFAAVTQYALGD